LLLINLHRTNPVNVTSIDVLGAKSATRQQHQKGRHEVFRLQPAASNDMSSTSVLLNGKKLELGPAHTLPKMPGYLVHRATPLLVGPRDIVFVKVLGEELAACSTTSTGEAMKTDDGSAGSSNTPSLLGQLQFGQNSTVHVHRDSSPVLSFRWHSAPAYSGGAVMVQGDFFQAPGGLARVRVCDAGRGCEMVQPLQHSNHTIKFMLPCTHGQLQSPSTATVAVCAAVAGRGQDVACTPPKRLNAPDVWWLSGDAGADSATASGGWLRLHGRNLSTARAASTQSPRRRKAHLCGGWSPLDGERVAGSRHLPARCSRLPQPGQR
jgi:hypothetical protein